MGLILCVNDIHARRRPPSSCTDSYWPDLLDLIDQCVQTARDRQARVMVLAGDIFDHKSPHRTDHALVRELKEHLVWPSPCPVVAVAGNHDMQHDRYDSVSAQQPLGGLEGPGGLRLLEGWAGPDEDDPNLVYGVPWQQDWSQEGITGQLADFRRASYGCSLVVTHAPIYPPGTEPRYPEAEFTPADWWADAMGNEGCLLYGHIHEPHGVWRHGGVTFCNYGALSRGSLDEYNRDRQVGCALWDDETGAFEFVPLKAKPAAEVFRLQRHAEAADARRSLDDFLAGVDAATLGLLDIESVMTHIRTLGKGRDVENLAEELLTAEQGRAR